MIVAVDVRWTAEQLAELARAAELEISARLDDGRWGRWTPIWVVVAGEDAFVRTWIRRDTGWYGAALRSRQAWIRVGRTAAEVRIATDGVAAVRDAVDAAYWSKYAGDGSMTSVEAVASTLRLVPAATGEPLPRPAG